MFFSNQNDYYIKIVQKRNPHIIAVLTLQALTSLFYFLAVVKLPIKTTMDQKYLY